MDESNPRVPDASGSRARSDEASSDIRLRALDPRDWTRVREIYEHGIATGNATFQAVSPSWEEWDAGHLRAPRIAAVMGDVVMGWAALSPVSRRPVYSGVTEVSVYVAEEARGRGIGGQLLQELVKASEAAGIWTLQAGIFPENTTSIALHERCGFRVVGRRERIGAMAGRWRDVILLERRSLAVGHGT
jgi:phosphinothricin acetyltransferase